MATIDHLDLVHNLVAAPTALNLCRRRRGVCLVLSTYDNVHLLPGVQGLKPLPRPTRPNSLFGRTNRPLRQGGWGNVLNSQRFAAHSGTDGHAYCLLPRRRNVLLCATQVKQQNTAHSVLYHTTEVFGRSISKS